MKTTVKWLEENKYTSATDYCRVLIKEGKDPSEVLEVYRGDMLSYTIRTILEGSALVYRENPKPHFVKYVDDTARLNALKGARKRTA